MTTAPHFGLLRLLFVGLGYYLLGLLGLSIPYLDSHLTLVWPASGLALAVLLRWGPGMWPGVLLGSLAVNFTIGSPLAMGIGVAVGNTLGPYLAARVLLDMNWDPRLQRREDLLRYLLVGVIGGMLVTSSNGTLNLILGGELGWDDWPHAWLVWFLGDAVGALIFGLPLITATREALRQALLGRHAIETLLLLALIVFIGVRLFWVETDAEFTLPLIFLPFLLLGWLALRRGLWAGSLAALLLSVLAVSGTALGTGPFQNDSLSVALMMLWSYVAVLTLIIALITALTGELATSEERKRLALDAAEDGVWDWEPLADRLYWNGRCYAMLGYPARFALTQARWLELVCPADREQALTLFEAMRTAEGGSAELRIRGVDGLGRWVLVRGRAVGFDAQGRALRVVGTFADIAQRKKIEEELIETESRLRTLIDSTPDIICFKDGAGRWLEANRADLEIFHLTDVDYRGKTDSELADYTLPLYREPFTLCEASDEIAWQAGRASRAEEVIPLAEGGARVFDVIKVPVFDDDGSRKGLVVLGRDITALKDAEKRIQHQAYYDALTDLPNRVLLHERAEKALNRASEAGGSLAVLFLDLDRFKEVNDSLGHAEGDRLLVEVARRLEAAMGPGHTLSRQGGDEFVVLIPSGGRACVEEIMTRIREALREPIFVAGHSLMASVSIGVALYPNDGESFDELLKNADTALYRAKSEGRGMHVFYDREMNLETFERLLLASALRKAIVEGQLEAYFQPKLDLRNGRVVGAEALVRWNHPEQGVVAPGMFIPVAESSALIIEIGDWMLDCVFRELARWSEQGIDPPPVAINLSARHFRSPDLAGRIAALLARHGVAPCLIELELTEATLLEAGTRSLDNLTALRELGVMLAIDDFGTGYSSLSYLKRLPIRTLKIDQSFVRDLESDADDRVLSATIVALGHSLGMTVVAEGVESTAQERILIEQGCDQAQGYLYTHPLPSNAFTQWLQAHRVSAV